MSENKTRPTQDDVIAYIENVENKRRREDAQTLVELMTDLTGYQPTMWGTSIIGFGSYHYVYESGREGDSMLVGFAPRKANLVLYITSGFEQYDHLLEKLGKYKTGKSCLYVNKLADVDVDILKQLITASVDHMKATNEVNDDPNDA